MTIKGIVKRLGGDGRVFEQYIKNAIQQDADQKAALHRNFVRKELSKSAKQLRALIDRYANDFGSAPLDALPDNFYSSLDALVALENKQEVL